MHQIQSDAAKRFQEQDESLETPLVHHSQNLDGDGAPELAEDRTEENKDKSRKNQFWTSLQDLPSRSVLCKGTRSGEKH